MKSSTYLTLFLSVTVLGTHLGWADESAMPAPYEEGIAILRDLAANGETLVKARVLLGKASAEGHHKAQGALGYMLLLGIGGEKDVGQAYTLIRAAAEAGVVSAQVNLAAMYEKGNGIGKDSLKSIDWYGKAAAGGSIPAHARLGDIHYFGAEGIPRDYLKALPHITKAAQAGDASARNTLGIMSEFGQGMETDYKAALHWYSLAAQQNLPKAQSNLGRFIKTTRTDEEGTILAYQWLKLAADQGENTAKFLLFNLERSLTPIQLSKGEEGVRQFKEKTRKADASAAGSGNGDP